MKVALGTYVFLFTQVLTLTTPPSVDLPKSCNDYSNPLKIVLPSEGVYGQGYRIIVLNFSWLYIKNNVDCYGTLRKKKDLPKDLWLCKPKKKVGVEPIRQLCEQNFMLM